MPGAGTTPGWTSAVPHTGHQERRSTHRYDLSLPLAVRPLTPRQAAPLRGRTRDISTGGIYFTIDQEFTPGSELAFTLILPAELTNGTEVLVCSQGQVVRTEKKMENGVERVGVAAVIGRYEIIRPDPLSVDSFVA